jgi:20S proteasome alpha/beta subunit
MTLCVAAACQDRGKFRIVVATDWKVSIGSASAEIEDKLYWIDDNTPVLIAGTISRAHELIETYRNHFDRLKARTTPVTIGRNDATRVLKKPPILFKKTLTEDYISLRFGLDYKSFRASVADGGIPESVAIDAYSSIGQITLDCELIVALFDEYRGPHIYKMNEYGDLEHCENFAAIGTGGTIAESTLYQREQQSELPLGPTVYHVVEAMKLGSIASDVGQKHTIDVLYPPGEKQDDVYMETLTPRAEKFLATQFKRLGPKRFRRLALPKNSFEKDL